jgi:hypothetical protein
MQGKSNFLRPGRARTNAQHLLGKTVNVGSECGGLKSRSLSSDAASGGADRVDDRGSLEDCLSEISRGTYVCNMFIIGVTPPFVKNCTLRVKVGWKRLAPKWTQLAISEASVASPMIIAGQVDVFPLQWGEVRK